MKYRMKWQAQAEYFKNNGKYIEAQRLKKE